MFGFKMKAEINSALLDILNSELINAFDEERQNLRRDVKEQIFKAQEQHKSNYDKRRKAAPIYKINDIVAIKRTQFVAGKKLASEYLGPYVITKVKRNDRYEVKKSENCEGPKQTSTSADNIKLWRFVCNSEELSSGSDDEEQNGRIEPLKSPGSSYDIALSRLLSIETKLRRNNNLKADYDAFMKAYIELQHMVLISVPSGTENYIPHHPMLKLDSSTTILRVVFDASCRTSTGKSLNDILR
ncbi:uncharacterized protein LOC118749911, partial [Rhagoletis pomonella]|uniref:uncharacterized protein LOC118749911 n=1 Tax=Rhagoletis pomonella TaxID=28610 RepID=UPI00178742E3